MDCKNCVSALVCKDAQDPSYREKIREGEISCCDFCPRPDDSLVFIMLYQYGVTEWTIQQNILAKCKRALERYEKFGEL